MTKITGKTKTKAIHPADIATKEQIKTAIYFNIHIRFGPHEKINVEAATLIDAIKAADELKLQYPGKRPLIYAITPEKFSIFVTDDIKAEAIEAAKDAEAAAQKAADKAAEQGLTSTDIAKLTAAITGGGYKRSNSKATAEARFRKIAAEAGFAAELIADLLAGPFDFSHHIIFERMTGKHASIPQATEARDAMEPANEADYPAPAPAEAKAAKPSAPKASKPTGKRAEILAAAQAGTLPPIPDFSAKTHERYRGKLAALIAMAQGGDLEGLKAFKTPPYDSSMSALERYRTLSIIAIEARAEIKIAA